MKLKSILAASAAASALTLAAPADAASYLSVFGGFGSFDGELSSPAFTYTTQRYKNVTGIATHTMPYKVTISASRRASYDFTTFGTVFRVTAAGSRSYVPALDFDAFDSGFVVGGAFGVELGSTFRTELELSYRNGDIDDSRAFNGTYVTYFATGRYTKFAGDVTYYPGVIAVTPTYTRVVPASDPEILYLQGPLNEVTDVGAFQGTGSTSGDFGAFAIMANLWTDFELGEGNPVVPFVGFGIGVANVSIEATNRVAFSHVDGNSTSKTLYHSVNSKTDADDWVFAWQLGAGLGYEFGNGMMLSAQYRYFSTSDIDVGGQDFSIQSHEALIGLNIPFGN